jgi:vacuolar-type H+-ATPase subunit H
LDDKRIQQVLDIEKQADGVYQLAISKAAQLPLQAEKDAQALLEKTRADANAEAKQIIAKAKSEEESDQITSDAQGRVHKMESNATVNLDRAIGYVLARVVGRE